MAATAQGSGSAALLLSVLAALYCSSLAVNIPIDWREADIYGSWSSTNNVRTGDTITFNWVGSHTATVVSQADWTSCTPNGIQSVANGGQLTVGTGTTYVICTVAGHCAAGMKVAITPASTPSTPTTPAPPTTPTSPTTPSPPRTPTTPTTPANEPSAASGLQAGTALVVASVALLL